MPNSRRPFGVVVSISRWSTSAAHRMGYCNWPTPSAWYVRFGSKADIRAYVQDVRFTPESGHVALRVKPSLAARSHPRVERAYSVRQPSTCSAIASASPVPKWVLGSLVHILHFIPFLSFGTRTGGDLLRLTLRTKKGVLIKMEQRDMSQTA
jgi:hypothetical protein